MSLFLRKLWSTRWSTRRCLPIYRRQFTWTIQNVGS
jgi:hypothetical protein